METRSIVISRLWVSFCRIMEFLISGSQTLMSLRITQGTCYSVNCWVGSSEFLSQGVREGLRIGIFHKSSGDASAAVLGVALGELQSWVPRLWAQAPGSQPAVDSL